MPSPSLSVPAGSPAETALLDRDMGEMHQCISIDDGDHIDLALTIDGRCNCPEHEH